MIKYVIVSCLAAVAFVSLAGCSSEEKHSSASESSSASLAVDSKDMKQHSDKH